MHFPLVNFLTLWVVKSLNIFFHLMQHLIVTGQIVVKDDFQRMLLPFPERRPATLNGQGMCKEQINSKLRSMSTFQRGALGRGQGEGGEDVGRMCCMREA